MRWNKLDTNFLVYSAVISVIAIVIGLYFYPYQINEDYLHISLNEEAAKYKAEQYINSRGWDISGYTFSCKYSQNHNDQKTLRFVLPVQCVYVLRGLYHHHLA